MEENRRIFVHFSFLFFLSTISNIAKVREANGCESKASTINFMPALQ